MREQAIILYNYLKDNIDKYNSCKISNHKISLDLSINTRRIQVLLLELEHNNKISRLKGYKRIIKVL
ncbi:MAG: hypothetical protein BWY78_00054 [Alphaproteobacteria bacterium ADurb.Bin438]|nr:MAG: hypothetical protein BWY78_00054 [Alphaproteobacteria bacterium ADurb.Bin438]